MKTTDNLKNVLEVTNNDLSFLNVGDIIWAKRYKTEKEKQNIIDNAISLIEIKYNKKLSNFEKIEFEK